MNIIIFCRHAVTVASAGCVVFIFALLCPIHTDQESDNCKRNEFKEGLIFTTCHLSVMLRFFFGYAMSFILCHEWLKLSELQNLTPERQVFSYSDSWPVKMGPIRCPETSVNNYHTTPRNIQEERRSHQHRGGSLKSKWEISCQPVIFHGDWRPGVRIFWPLYSAIMCANYISVPWN